MVDASAAVEFLLRTAAGAGIEPTLLRDRVLAPELIDAEVLAVVRREHLAGRIDEVRARQALEDLRDWDLERVAHRGLLDHAWTLRHNVSAYDALYVAAAKLHGATLLTADGPLSRVASLGVQVVNVSAMAAR